MLAMVWANRGDVSDQFDAAFGVAAEVARGVVDSALAEWNRVVTGYQGAAFDVQMTIAMNPTNPALSAFASNTVSDSNGVPISGTVTINMALDMEGNTQWFLDPTPDENSEFMGTLAHAYARSPTPGGPAAGMRDLRTLLVHELGHTMGVSSGSTLMYSNAAVTVTNTGITDNSVGSGGNSYWLFQGPSVNAVLTDFDISAIVTSSAGHAAMPVNGNPAINFNGQQYFTAVDTMQPTSLSIRRILLSEKVALMMQDMGYDVVMPELNGTFHSVLNQSAGLLTIQGGNDATRINNINQGPSSDTIVVRRVGNSIIVNVDVGVDVPGSGPGLTVNDQQDAFVSVFDVSDVQDIRIEGFGGNDQISLIGNFDFLNTLEVFGGLGDDTVDGEGLTGNQALIAFGGDGNDTLRGGLGDDKLHGERGNDTIEGNDGRDLLEGASGSDLIRGGKDNDRIVGGHLIPSLAHPLSDGSSDSLFGDEGEDIIIGDDGFFAPLLVRSTIGGNDIIRAGADDDLVFGGAGNDNIHGQGGDDVIAAGAGSDIVLGGWLLSDGQSFSDGADFINGEEGHDVIYGDNLDPSVSVYVSVLGGDDILWGGDGNDTILGQTGHDEIDGDDGNDFLHGGEGNDDLRGGDGNDVLTGDAGFDLIFGNSGKDELNGGADDDILVGGTGDDIMRGDSGNDDVNGEDGNDRIVGGFGDDKMSGGNGNDVMIGGLESLVADFGDDILDGGDGNDLILGDSGTTNPLQVSALLGGNDTIQGGPGNDKIYAMGGNDFVGGGSGNDQLDLGSGDDIANGDSGNDVLLGGLGNDVLAGSAGEDTLHGDSGNDWLIGGHFAATGTALTELDNDWIYGGTGDDILIGDSWSLETPLVEGEAGGNDSLIGGTGDDFLLGQAGNDSLRGSDGNDELDGGSGDDNLAGELGNDNLMGGRGNDILRGNDGEDQLSGGLGDDILMGGFGIDSMAGNEGRDLLIGGGDADRMNGNEDDDILIAGYVLFEGNDVALIQLMAEWTSVRSFKSRVANIRGQANPEFVNRLNANTYLKKGSTFQNDSAVDLLSGSTGMDWFLLDLAAPLPDDVLADLEADEEIN